MTPSHAPSIFLATLVGLVLLGFPAQAHYSTAEKGRTILVDEDNEHVTLYVRSPLSLFFPRLLTGSGGRGVSMDSPFLTALGTEAGRQYRVNLQGIRDDPGRFADVLTGGLGLYQHDQRIPLELVGFRIKPRSDETPFTSPAEAKRSIAAQHKVGGSPWVLTAVVEAILRGKPLSPKGPLQLSEGYPPVILGPGVEIRNTLTDLRSSPPTTLPSHGLLKAPVSLSGSLFASFLAFAAEGARHIAFGPDHVAFLLCLLLVARGPRHLLLLITGFTVGHSLTLVCGVLGWIPQSPWIIATAEIGIAASVVWLAFEARAQRHPGIWITSALGLLHGLGFAYGLGKLLGPHAPHLTPHLVAFNVGVELGQLALVGLLLVVHVGLKAMDRGWETRAQQWSITLCMLLGGIWIATRIPALF